MGILRSEGEDGRGRMKAAYKTCLSCGRPMKKAQYDDVKVKSRSDTHACMLVEEKAL